jgi:hypothetical protein
VRTWVGAGRILVISVTTVSGRLLQRGLCVIYSITAVAQRRRRRQATMLQQLCTAVVLASVVHRVHDVCVSVFG